MGNSRKISLIINFIFIVILVLILLYFIFNLTSPMYVRVFEDSKQVEDENTINELQECITKYYDYLYFGQYEKVKYCNNILNRKTSYEYEKIHNEILSYGEYVVVVKYAYKLVGDMYRCYIVTYDKTNENDLNYLNITDTLKMDKIVVSLDRFSNNFTILYDEYHNI